MTYAGFPRVPCQGQRQNCTAGVMPDGQSLADGAAALTRATCSTRTTPPTTSPSSAPRPTWRGPGHRRRHHPDAMQAMHAIRQMGLGGRRKVFGLSESQIARRVKVIAKAAGLADWEYFSGHNGRVGMTRRIAQNDAPSHEIKRQDQRKQSGGMIGRYTRVVSAK